MSKFGRIIAELKKQERHLASQLAGIRTAISSLEFGSSGAPRPAIIETPNAARPQAPKRGRRKLSAAALARISAAQRKRWAKVRADKG